MATRVRPSSNDLRKRPRQARSVAMVTAILDAAARMLEAEGLDGLTTNAVADRAGVSVGSLYQYFPSRSAILAELTRRERAKFRARIDAVASDFRQATFETAVRALVDAAVDHQLDSPALARALDYIEPSLALGADTAKLAGDIVRTVEGLLRYHGISRPAEAARDLVAMGKGMIDAAGLAGESNSKGLAVRVSRAMLGYLRN